MDLVYIGHQTLLVESGGVRILVDPVLRAGMPEERVAMYPRKRVDDAGLFPVHAVVITHTHLDHVDHEAFTRINKDAILFVSCLSYGRLAPFLADHGFDPGKIIPLQPTSQVRVGPIRVSGARFGRLTNEQGLGEPDVTPVVLHDGEAGILNFVDIFPHAPAAVEEVERAFGPLTAVLTAWNYTRTRTDILAGPLDREAELGAMADNLAATFSHFGVPNALVVGNGFVLDGSFAPFNRHLFPIAKPELCERINALGGPVHFLALEVGRRYHLAGTTIRAGDAVPWITVDDDGGEAQRYQPAASIPQGYVPFLGRRALDADERTELEDFLGEEYTRYLQYRYLPQFFFAGLVYRGRYHEGVGFWLDDGGAGFGYRFVRDTNGVEMIACARREEVLSSHAWIEMTAVDLLGLVRGDIVLIDPIYYDLRSHPEFLEAIEAPIDALFREPMGIFDPFFHGRAVERAVLGPRAAGAGGT